MTLKVEILRRPDGTLEAFVVQDGRRGPNLLDRKTKSVANARLAIQAGYAIAYRVPVDIEFVGESPDSDHVRAADKRIATPRDRYGWRSLP
jgi:hypothetical protein